MENRVVRNGYSPESKGNLHNIVVFGESGVGKSSLINMIAGHGVAETSADVKGCTFAYKHYEFGVGKDSYRVWDTVGLDEGTFGTVPAELAEKSLKTFLLDLSQTSGINLLVYCVRGSRITTVTLRNYELFYSAICRRMVPIVVIVTALENYDGEMDEWWAKNKRTFAQYGLHFDGVACVTTLPEEKVHPQLRQRWMDSRQRIWDLLQLQRSTEPWLPRNQNQWALATLQDIRAVMDTSSKEISPNIVVVENHPSRHFIVLSNVLAIVQRRYNIFCIFDSDINHQSGINFLHNEVDVTHMLVLPLEQGDDAEAFRRVFNIYVNGTSPVLVLVMGASNGAEANARWNSIRNPSMKARVAYVPPSGADKEVQMEATRNLESLVDRYCLRVTGLSITGKWSKVRQQRKAALDGQRQLITLQDLIDEVRGHGSSSSRKMTVDARIPSPSSQSLNLRPKRFLCWTIRGHDSD